MPVRINQEHVPRSVAQGPDLRVVGSAIGKCGVLGGQEVQYGGVDVDSGFKGGRATVATSRRGPGSAVAMLWVAREDVGVMGVAIDRSPSGQGTHRPRSGSAAHIVGSGP